MILVILDAALLAIAPAWFLAWWAGWQAQGVFWSVLYIATAVKITTTVGVVLVREGSTRIKEEI